MNGISSGIENIRTQVSNYTLNQSMDINADKMAQVLASAPAANSLTTGFKLDIIA